MKDSSRGNKRSYASALPPKEGALGFEAFRISNEFSSPTYSGTNNSFVLPFHALLTKRDAITRLKALSDLEDLMYASSSEDVRETLPHFAFLYTRNLQKDNDRRIRIATAKIILALVQKVPRAMSVLRLDSFGADWLCSRFDTDKECSLIATKAMELADIQEFSPVVVAQLNRMVRQRSPDETLIGSFPSEDAELLTERSNRVRVQSLRSLAYLCTRQSNLELEDSNWSKFLFATEDEGGVNARIASYQILSNIDSRPSSLWKLSFRIISEKESRAIEPMFACVTRLSQHSEFWDNPESLKKGFFPEFFRLLRRLSFEIDLVPFLSRIPLNVYLQFQTQEDFYQEVLESLRTLPNLGIECLAFLSSQDEISTDFLQEKLSAILPSWFKSSQPASLRSIQSFQVLLKESRRRLSFEFPPIETCSPRYLELCQFPQWDDELFVRHLLPQVEAYIFQTKSVPLLQACRRFLSYDKNFKEWISYVKTCSPFVVELCKCDSKCFEALVEQDKDVVALLHETKNMKEPSPALEKWLSLGNEVCQEDLVCHRLSVEGQRIRAQALVSQAWEEVNKKHSFNPTLLTSLSCYPNFNEARLVRCILAAFCGSEVCPLSELTQEEKSTMVEWLSECPSTISPLSSWIRLASDVHMAFPKLPKVELLFRYLNTGSDGSLFQNLLNHFQGSRVEFFVYVFSHQKQERLVIFELANRQARQNLQLSLGGNWFPDWFRYCSSHHSGEGWFQLVVEEFMPEQWVAESVSSCCVQAIGMPHAHAVVLPSLLQMRSNLLHVCDFQQEIKEQLHACWLQACYFDATTENEVKDTLPLQSEQESNPSVAACFAPGDTASYVPSNLNRAIPVKVVARHIEDFAEYYTIHFRDTDGSNREVQTIPNRLSKWSAVEPESLEDEAQKQEKLAEIQQALSRARKSGDRAETIRLMNAASALAIKPKDTEQQKQEEVLRKKRVAEGRENNASSPEPNEDDDELYSTDEERNNHDESEIHPVFHQMHVLVHFSWRLEHSQFPLSEEEKAALLAFARHCSSFPVPRSKLRVVCLFFHMLPNTEDYLMSWLSRLLQPCCDARVGEFVDAYNELNLHREGMNSKLLLALEEEETEDVFAQKLANTLLPKARFSSRLVWDLFPALLSRMLSPHSSAPVVHGVFLLLIRYPELSQTNLPVLLKEEFELVEEEEKYLLLWLLLVRHLPTLKEEAEDLQWIDRHLNSVLDRIISLVDISIKVEEDLNMILQSNTCSLQNLAGFALFSTTHALPHLVRAWWTDHLTNRNEREFVQRYLSQAISPWLLRSDMKELASAKDTLFDPAEFSIKLSPVTRTVLLTSFKDDSCLEMQLSFPESYPLFPVEVECTKSIGVRVEKWKRWALQIVQLLNKRKGSLLDAIQLWKRNLDKEFEGIEPCPICYSVLQNSDSSLPKLQCRTCKNVFHGLCLNTWFTTSHQSLCPLCKQSFMSS